MDNFEMIFADKKINSIGLQLADLTVRPISRYIMNPHQENRAWKIIEKKLTTEGIKVFPKNEKLQENLELATDREQPPIQLL